MTVMMRLRLKADGRIVEILSDGSERALGGHFSRSQAGADMPPAGRAGSPPDAALCPRRACPHQAHAGAIRRPYRRPDRDGAQLGAGQALATRSRACPAQGDRVRSRCRIRRASQSRRTEQVAARRNQSPWRCAGRHCPSTRGTYCRGHLGGVPIVLSRCQENMNIVERQRRKHSRHRSGHHDAEG